jgi:hypothetical protein
VEYSEIITLGAKYAALPHSVVVIEATRCNVHWRFNNRVSGVVLKGTTEVFDHLASGGVYTFASRGIFTLKTGTEAEYFRKNQRTAAALVRSEHITCGRQRSKPAGRNGSFAIGTVVNGQYGVPHHLTVTFRCPKLLLAIQGSRKSAAHMSGGGRKYDPAPRTNTRRRIDCQAASAVQQSLGDDLMGAIDVALGTVGAPTV